MHLFISWSGGKSHRLAAAMKEWLESHFPDEITAFVSSEIEKGRQWFPAVESQLRKADAGLVCLTPESLKSDWVAFEAGALATAVAFKKREADLHLSARPQPRVAPWSPGGVPVDCGNDGGHASPREQSPELP